MFVIRDIEPEIRTLGPEQTEHCAKSQNERLSNALRWIAPKVETPTSHNIKPENPQGPTVAELVAGAAKWVAIGPSKDTGRRMGSALRNLGRFLVLVRKRWKWSEVTEEDFVAFMDAPLVNGQAATPCYRHERAKYCRKLSTWARIKGQEAEAGEHLEAKQVRTGIPAPSKEDVAKLLEPNLEPKVWELCLQAALEIAYSGGARVSEIATLQLADVDLGAKTALVCGKGRKERLIYLNESSIRAIMEWLAKGRPFCMDVEKHGELLVSIRGNAAKRGTLEDGIRARCAQRGLPKIRFHDLRRAYATHLVENGMKFEEVSKLLGHSRKETTQAYVQVSLEHKLAVYKAAMEGGKEL